MSSIQELRDLITKQQEAEASRREEEKRRRLKAEQRLEELDNQLQEAEAKEAAKAKRRAELAELAAARENPKFRDDPVENEGGEWLIHIHSIRY